MSELATIEPAQTAPTVQPVGEGAALISIIERAARDPSVDIEKFERLMMMKERVDAQNAMRAFNDAVALAKGETRSDWLRRPLSGAQLDYAADDVRHLHALYRHLDAALAAQNAAVALESLGLGCCYIGAMRNKPQIIADLLHLPAGALGVFGLCVGYADPAKSSDVKPRLPQQAVLFHGRYGVDAEGALISAYDQDMGAFSKRHEMSDDTWTGRVLNRQSDIKNLNGRETLVSTLHAMGFQLK